ncbi:RNA polymerase sigma factor [Mesobacillus sp. AQ2]|jgi:RNA polymerase sigma-70 factor, ECF subfamily|uniref:RNA polymerase sigma factor n=1 Tax=Bacillaceae TaxID=186817 RepID=UPI0011A1947F|nr:MULTISPECIES: RNA polymerase sigma factor [Bacillaceae]MCM3125202.1 RNA polymerase sigma factor [Mesobacillus sp. MER 33]MCM3235367.1 RNA polymerase sigma factor [Mesobacillus sp. MER 48]WHX40957.1 RNA polymerase sigma factor [Mesobacillus sp. AQ2]
MNDPNKDYEKMEELYDLYEQKIYYLAYSVLNNIQQAEDTVQETFITLYQHIDKVHCLNKLELKRYILRIAKNKAIDSYRKNKRLGIILDEYQKETTEAANENIKDWEQGVISEAQIDTLLTTLKNPYKLVFKYKVFYDLSYHEISELIGITEANVRKQFERARKSILTILGGRQSDEFKKLKKNG